MKTTIFLCLIAFTGSLPCLGQTATDTPSLYLSFPLVDVPYQSFATRTTGNVFAGYGNPSMKQSLAMSNNLYSAMHFGISRLVKTNSEFKNILFANLLATGVDLVTVYTPLGMGWLHEEYHRAVMTRREINSFNDMNTFPFGEALVYVRNVSDEDLINLSDNHNPDFRRLMVAGNEAQYQQIRTLQQNDFFYKQGLPHLPLYWMSTMTNISYVIATGSDEFDAEVDQANAADGADIAGRDFAGPDFTAWADALFFPDRPYADRGLHPSGVGINRYIKPGQLTADARAYLQQQGRLQWLNLLSPHLIGFPRIKLTTTGAGDYYGSFAVRHYLTPFGNDIALDLFCQTPTDNWFLSFHNYNNLDNAFFGIEGAWIDKPLFSNQLLLSLTSMVWLQPENQSFTTSSGSLGGMLKAKGSYHAGQLSPFLEIEAKTAGWVMGNVFLDDNVSLTLGLDVRLR